MSKKEYFYKTSLTICFLIVLFGRPAFSQTSGNDSSIVSDDFHGSTLDTTVWKFIDPVGDASYRMTGTNVIISLPGGTDHDFWRNGNNAARLVQSIKDEDFEVEVKFDTELIGKFAMQGILVEDSNNRILRIGFYRNNTALVAFVSSFINYNPTIRFEEMVSENGILFIKIRRNGNSWDHSFSTNGIDWILGARFNFEMQPNLLGIYAGSAGDFPSNDVSIDYFVNSTSPIENEDEAKYSSLISPSDLLVEIKSDTEILLNWNDNSIYEDGFIIEKKVNNLDFEEIVRVGTDRTSFIDKKALIIGDTYTYRLCAFNQYKKSNYSNETIFQYKPKINLFYGEQQQFGTPGLSQHWINILGNVFLSQEIVSLLYSLNNTSFKPINLGPDLRRLVYPGDFNIELHETELVPGQNTLIIKGLKTNGDTISKLINIQYDSENQWPINYQINWNTTQNIQEVVQVVDGDWYIDQNEFLRTKSPGYDRLIAIGDSTWQNYEITVPIFIHNFVEMPDLGSGPGVGLICGWRGHFGEEQPRPDVDSGYLAWYRLLAGNYRLQIINKYFELIFIDSSNKEIRLGKWYNFKLRNELLNKGTTIFFKVWEKYRTEPPDWDLKVCTGINSYGSIGLIAHKADVSIGNIEVTDLIHPSIVEENSRKIVSNRKQIDIFPNPQTEFTNVILKFYSTNHQDGKLQIFNLLGQKVNSIAINNIRIGENIIFWDGMSANKTFVSNGIYFFRLLIGKDKFNGKFIIAR